MNPDGTFKDEQDEAKTVYMLLMMILCRGQEASEKQLLIQNSPLPQAAALKRLLLEMGQQGLISIHPPDKNTPQDGRIIRITRRGLEWLNSSH